MKRNILVQALRTAGHDPIQLQNEMGSALLVLPYGARILGMFCGENANLLWANPMLGEPKTAIEFFATPGWRNTGGDRTWVSPERDINVRNLEDPWNSYEFPESVDPGKFNVDFNEHEVRLTTHAEVIQRRLRLSCQIHLEKRIRLVPNPLRYEPNARSLLESAAYVGYEQVTSLTYAHELSAFRPLLSIWDAVELPAPGEVIIPTVGSVKARDFFEPTGPRHLIQSFSGLRFVFDAQERHKIAVRATDLLGGRAGYFCRLTTGECTLVVRNFAIDPSSEYVDTPWDDPADRGYVLECYNDSGLNGDYGELEYHSPAMGDGTGRTDCFDRAQLWGFQGSEGVITELMQRFLGSAITDEFFSRGSS